MRFYRVEITTAAGAPVLPASLYGAPISSLSANGQFNPAALDIEFDLPVVNFATPDSNCWLKIKGIGLAQIGSASNLNGMNISVYGGMSKGLPLAKPAQQGLLVKGQIFQGFGNWVGIEQSIQMNIIAGGTTGSPDHPGNFPWVWKANTPMSVAIAQALTTGLPGVTQQISISPKLVQNSDDVGWYPSLQTLAQHVIERAEAITGEASTITISTKGGTVIVGDGTVTAPAAISIAFEDLIGQPTWIGPNQIECKFVLRGDLDLQTLIKLPQTLQTTTQASLLQFQQKTTFTGNYYIQQMHHYGSFRQSDAAAWNTTVYATPQTKEQAAAPVSTSTSGGGGPTG